MDKNKCTSELKKTGKNETELMKLINIGALAKRKRLELNLSQKEVSHKICSISYLSKIETNKIIPNKECLNLLMERIHIDEKEIRIIENSRELLNNAITYFYLKDEKEYENLYNDIKDTINNQYVEVVILGYYVMKKDLVRAKEIVDRNYELISSMDIFYIKAFSLFSAEYMLLKKDYSSVNKFIDTLYETEIPSEMFGTLLKDISFRLYEEERRVSLAAKLYHELITYYSERAHIKRIVETQLSFIKLLYETSEFKEVVDICLNSTITSDLMKNEEFNYIVAKSLYMEGKAQKSLEYFNKLRKDSIYYEKSLLEIYELIDEKDEMEEEIKTKDSNSFFNQYFLAKINDDITRDIFDKTNYKEIIQSSCNSEKIALLKLERSYLENTCRYKEANAIAGKILRLSKI